MLAVVHRLTAHTIVIPSRHPRGSTMSLETETVLDRRSLRRRLGFWRGFAIVLAALALIPVLGSLFSRSSQQGASGFAGIGETRQIARVAIDGTITEDRDQLRMLRRIASAKHVEGLLLTINSPGGTTTGGEALFDALREVAKTKPVVAQFGTVAASAGYIVGLACDHIVARGNSITGSVGVIFQWPEVSQLLDRLGVKVNEIKSGPLKAVPSPFTPLDQGGRSVTEQMVADSQKWFLGLVADRRKIDTATVPGLEQGRIFSGREAAALKLVDEIGGEKEAMQYFIKRGIKTTRVIDWKPRRDTDYSFLPFVGQWLGSLLGVGDRFAASSAERLVERLRLDGLVSVWQPTEN
jgi:protease-4